MASLIREVIQNNPPLTHLNLEEFSQDKDGNESAGEIILESLLNSSICTIQHLNIGGNFSWFKKSKIEDREGATEMLMEVISNQTSQLQILNLYCNGLSMVSTNKLLTKIAECGVCSTLEELNLEGANFVSQ